MKFTVKKQDIPIGKLVEVSVSPKIIVFNNGEQIFAVSGICPHAKWPLELGFVKGQTLTCGGHGWEFDISKGNCVTNPGRDLKNYRVIENQNEVIIFDE
ncbi:Rieske (2Fe-2S) protein [Nitrosopumilus maritimus]|uniref:Rieske (2Fe-2S) domain protein n=1 Tax=Nitrosopumilus maritimus (strain SCM1) TaxID=436308 RepID=A9A1T7_NITMS|nr:Rieske (2Fe-2S) protein [Nitrosopumilus maritimus]ABX12058.1 Rieske (2Fe-2S) domain protein [Nitrosopumilus maritimus SCM1]